MTPRKPFFHTRLVTGLWWLLIGLTVFSAYMADFATPGFGSTAIMAGVLAVKGRIIVDHFMELKHSNRLLRNLMRWYFYVIPALIMLVFLFPQLLARWTSTALGF